MELKNEPKAQLEAVIIESRLDKSRGPVASAIVKKGTLHNGDIVFAENIYCKVKAMIDSNGKNTTCAGPSTPVEILGFEKTPSVGALILDHSVETPNLTPLRKDNVPTDSSIPHLNVVLRADVEGTLEALKNSFSDDVHVISAGVGAVTDNDIFQAENAKAEIFAFNVAVPKFIKNLADNQKVKIFESKIIYEIIENIQAQVLKLLDPTIEETTLGEAKIIAEFKIEKVRIAGMQVTKGELTKGDSVHLKRDNQIIKDTKVEGIHQAKNIIDKAKAGNEYGITFRPYIDFKLGDVIIAYK